MTKYHYSVIILGMSLFFINMTYGVGWLLGWIFVGLLRHYRVPILERMIDFDNFSAKQYVGYLLLVMVWIAIPLLISFTLPLYVNPIAVFGALFADRILVFFVNSISKKEAI